MESQENISMILLSHVFRVYCNFNGYVCDSRNYKKAR